MLDAFYTSTHLGAYLYQQKHFRPNGLVGFVTDVKLKLQGFADASGNDVATDKILTVNGCLSTPDKWRDFDNEWQNYLLGEKFTPDKDTGKCVFHTNKFHTGNLKGMPKGLSRHARVRIYDNLLGIICKYTVFRFGFGIHLEDFWQVEAEYPYAREEILRHPGTFASSECFQWNSVWAEKNGYDGSIAYVFDRGDEFWGEMYEQFRSTLKVIDPEHRTVYSLSEGNKADQSPLQAADIIAWESRRYSLSLSRDHLNRVIPAACPRDELNRLLYPGPSHADLRVYSRNDFIEEIHQHFEHLLAYAEMEYLQDKYVGEGKYFPNLDEFARAYLEICKEEDTKKREALLEKWKGMKERKSDDQK